MIRVSGRNYSHQDREHLESCLSHHQDSNPQRWIDGGLQIFCDEDGNKLYVKVEKVVRLHILHDPSLPKRVTANLILQGGIQLRALLKDIGFKEMLFESKAAPLIKFTGKLLGFNELKDNYMAVL